MFPLKCSVQWCLAFIFLMKSRIVLNEQVDDVHLPLLGSHMERGVALVVPLVNTSSSPQLLPHHGQVALTAGLVQADVRISHHRLFINCMQSVSIVGLRDLIRTPKLVC